MNEIDKFMKTNLSIENEDVNLFPFFLDFLKGLLTIDPKKRLNVNQALSHPYITGQSLIGKLINLIVKNHFLF